MGQQLFIGGFGYCSDPTFPPGEPMKGVRIDESLLYHAHDDDFRYIKGNYTVNSLNWKVTPCLRPEHDPLLYGGAHWTTPNYNYDDFFNSMVATFTLSLGGWSDLLEASMSFRAPDVQPIPGSGPALMLYVMLGVVVFGLYFQNLFAGIVYESFVRSKCVIKTGMLLSTEERRWVAFEEKIMKYKPHVKPQKKTWSAMHVRCDELVLSGGLDKIVAVALGINFIAMTFTHADSSHDLVVFQQVVNIITTGVFCFELLVKFGLWGLDYFRFDLGVHVFDLAITIVSVADVVEQLYLGGGGFGVQQECRVLTSVRTLRVFRLVLIAKKFIPSMGIFVGAVAGSLKKVWALSVVFLVILFVFANVGEVLFTRVFKIEMSSEKYNAWATFGTTSQALQLLFMLSTGDEWENYLNAMLDGHGGGSSSDYNNEEDSWADMQRIIERCTIICFFLAFQVFATVILMNLFVMIVVESYEIIANPLRASAEEAIAMFRTAWQEVDPMAEGYMHPDDVELFLKALPPPLGVSGRNDLTALEMEIACDALIHSPEFDYSFNRTLISFASAFMLQEKRAKNPGSNFLSPEDAVKAVRVVRKAVRLFIARKARRATMEAANTTGTLGGIGGAGGGGGGGGDGKTDQTILSDVPSMLSSSMVLCLPEQDAADL